MNATPRRAGPDLAGEVGEEARVEAVEVHDLGAAVREQLPSLLRYAAALTGDRDLAGALVQEVLVRSHQRSRHIELLERPDLHLRRMVTNAHLTWRRHRDVRPLRPASDGRRAIGAVTVTCPAPAVAEHDALEKALAGLSPRHRSLLVLRFLEGLDDNKIAVVLGMAPASVRSHASRALQVLRAQACAVSRGL